jgi:hypothetical protein
MALNDGFVELRLDIRREHRPYPSTYHLRTRHTRRGSPFVKERVQLVVELDQDLDSGHGQDGTNL